MPRRAPISQMSSQASIWVLLFAAFSMLPGSAHAWEARRDTKRQIELMEQQWRTAQLTGDVSTMDHMLADDYVGITVTGQVTTKAQQLARVRNHALVLTRLDMEETKIKLVGEVAIVTVRARVEGSSDVRPINGEYSYTRIYHQLPSGTWKITNFEATRLSPHRHGLEFGFHNGQAS